MDWKLDNRSEMQGQGAPAYIEVPRLQWALCQQKLGDGKAVDGSYLTSPVFK